MKPSIQIVCALSFLVGCVDEADETTSGTETSEAEQALLPVDDLNIPDELRLAPRAELKTGSLPNAADLPAGQLEAQRYCVDQSYASADYVSCDYFFQCSNTNWDTQLSRNHPVHIYGCGSSTYVLVHSLWNAGRCYLLRRDALSPC